MKKFSDWALETKNYDMKESSGSEGRLQKYGYSNQKHHVDGWFSPKEPTALLDAENEKKGNFGKKKAK